MMEAFEAKPLRGKRNKISKEFFAGANGQSFAAQAHANPVREQRAIRPIPGGESEPLTRTTGGGPKSFRASAMSTPVPPAAPPARESTNTKKDASAVLPESAIPAEAV